MDLSGAVTGSEAVRFLGTVRGISMPAVVRRSRAACLSGALILIVVVLSLGLLIAQQSDDEPFLPNLIGNPSFESSTAGWSPYGEATLQRVDGGFHGSFSLEMRGSSSLVPFGAHDRTPWVASTGPKGTHFRASAWVRSTLHGGRVFMRILETANGKEAGSSARASVTLSKDWQLLVTDYVTKNAGSQLEIQIVDQPRARSEAFRTDNITVLAVPSEEMLKEWRKRAPRPPDASGDLS